jgi:hypothetical protein
MSSSTGAIIAIIILFILVTVAIVLAIVALVNTGNGSKASFVSIKAVDSNGAASVSYNITQPTYIYFNVGLNSTLGLSGKEGAAAVVRNDSSSSAHVTISGSPGTTLQGTKVADGKFLLTAGNTAIVVWKSDSLAIINRI